MRVTPLLGWIESSPRALWRRLQMLPLGMLAIGSLVSGRALWEIEGNQPDLTAVGPYRLGITIHLWTVLVLLGMVAIALSLMSTVTSGFWRGRLRYRALHGSPDLLPPARVSMSQVAAPDVSLIPLDGLSGWPRGWPQVTADAVGVHQGNRVVRWEDARLLEVGQPGGQDGILYILRAADAYIAWRAYELSASAVPSAFEKHPTYRETHALLVALIQARTGLTPRTLDDKLLAPGAALPRGGPAWWIKRLAGAFSDGVGAIIMALVGMPLLVAIAINAAYVSLVLPITSVPALNVYAALVYVALAVLLAVLDLWLIPTSVGKLLRRSSQDSLPTLPEPPAFGAYTLGWRDARTRRIASTALALACLACAAPGLLSLVVIPRDPQFGGSTAFWLAIPLLILGLGGLIALLSQWLAREPAAIAITGTGLAMRKTAIDWEQVRSLTWKGRLGKGQFTITSTVAGKTITWPARPAHPVRQPPPGAQPITSLELAALVAARSGVPLEGAR